jgi:hypothetical protein
MSSYIDTPTQQTNPAPRTRQSLVALAFKAVALALSTAAVVLTILGIATATLITILSIGLFALALSAFLDRPGR